MQVIVIGSSVVLYRSQAGVINHLWPFLDGFMDNTFVPEYDDFEDTQVKPFQNAFHGLTLGLLVKSTHSNLDPP